MVRCSRRKPRTRAKSSRPSIRRRPKPRPLRVRAITTVSTKRLWGRSSTRDRRAWPTTMGAASDLGWGFSSSRHRGKASEDWPRECRREARLRGHWSLMRSAQASISSGRQCTGSKVNSASLGAGVSSSWCLESRVSTAGPGWKVISGWHVESRVSSAILGLRISSGWCVGSRVDVVKLNLRATSHWYTRFRVSLARLVLTISSIQCAGSRVGVSLVESGLLPTYRIQAHLSQAGNQGHLLLGCGWLRARLEAKATVSWPWHLLRLYWLSSCG